VLVAPGRFNSGVALDQPASVPLGLASSVSEAKGVLKSKATDLMGAPSVAAVKAPQLEVMAVPLICVSCCVTIDQAGTKRMRMASSGVGEVEARRFRPSVDATEGGADGCALEATAVGSKDAGASLLTKAAMARAVVEAASGVIDGPVLGEAGLRPKTPAPVSLALTSSPGPISRAPGCALTSVGWGGIQRQPITAGRAASSGAAAGLTMGVSAVLNFKLISPDHWLASSQASSVAVAGAGSAAVLFSPCATSVLAWRWAAMSPNNAITAASSKP
jgi:hypothetical protein